MRVLRGCWVVLTRRAHRPIVWKAWHVWGLAALAGALLVLVIVTSHLNRESLLHEREARVASEFARLRDRDQLFLTRKEVATLAQTQARLIQPSRVEQLHRINVALKTCARSPSCRREFVRTVNRIVRSPGGSRLIPADRSTPMPSRTVTVVRPPPPFVPPAVKPSEPAPSLDSLIHRVSRLEADVRALQSRKSDSGTLDGLDNRVAALEQGLSSVLGRLEPLQRLVQTLCRVLARPNC
jgi:hypothetical protein